MSFVTINEGRFVDANGRHMLLHGINLVNKNQSDGYLGPEGPDEFAAWRGWGLNCVRLGVIWDGLESQPGVYNEAYLQGIDRRIAWAAENDLFVILDMHQDLYSVLYADGAPQWATLAGDQPHISESEVWSDAYFTSPAVKTAWDNFWDNAPAPDGVGLQDHYAACWALLAARYRDNPAVIGYDLMNEPMPGSIALQGQLLMFAKGAEFLGESAAPDGGSAESDGPGGADLAELWLTPDGRSQILELLRDTDLYAAVADAPEALYAQFERQKLMPFYRRVAAAIRAKAQNHIVFLETTIGSNLGMRSHIEPLTFEGRRDPLQAYAPHGYDLVTDTPDIANASPERVEFVFQRHGETAARLKMPMLVGEWGAYDRHPDTLEPALHVVRQFELLLCSETYWAYLPRTEEMPCFRAINRPYPQSVAGTLIQYGNEADEGIFTCSWLEDPAVEASSTLYLPDWFRFDERCLELSPAGEIEVQSAGAGIFLSVRPVGRAVTRQFKITQG